MPQGEKIMTHFLVIVIGIDIEDQLTKDENCKKWDWYMIGGRYTGYFQLKPGAPGMLGKPGLYQNFQTKPESADIARAGDIDWESMVNKLGYDLVYPDDIVKDGVWHCYANHYEFAIDGDPKMSRVKWFEKIREVISSTDEDDMITAVDCHC